MRVRESHDGVSLYLLVFTFLCSVGVQFKDAYIISMLYIRKHASCLDAGTTAFNRSCGDVMEGECMPHCSDELGTYG